MLARATRVSLEQSWAYAESTAISVAGVARYFAWRDRAVAACIDRRWWRVWPVRECLRGPVWLDPEMSELERVSATAAFLHAAFGARQVFGLRFWTPDIGTPGQVDDIARGAGMHRVFTGHATICVRVCADEAAQRAQLEGKWRNALIAGEARARYRVHVSRERRWVAEIGERYDALRRQRGFTGPSGASLTGAVERLPPGHRFAVVIERGGAMLAGGLFLCHGDMATWVAGWASPAALAEAGQRRVLMGALEELRRLGMGSLDLGGIDTRSAPGIARFKLGLGGAVWILPGTWAK